MSIEPSHAGGSPSGRKHNFLLLQDDPPSLSTHGQGTLHQLIIRNRSHSSLQHHGSYGSYGSNWRASNGYDAADAESAASRRPASVRGADEDYEEEHRRPQMEERRLTALLTGSHMRSMRLIGNSSPRYNWERYWKTEEQLRAMSKPVRRYYERTNYLVQQYLYIDRLLDSSLPHDLLNEYSFMPASNFRGVEIPDTIREERSSSMASRSGLGSPTIAMSGASSSSNSRPGTPTGLGGDAINHAASKRVKRTPKDIYRATETTPLFAPADEAGWDGDGPKPEIPWLEEDDDLASGDRIVTIAIWLNFAANTILLAGKIAVVASVSSMSVLASLVDAALDFLSTVIVFTTTWLISRQDQYRYPVGRRRLEPIGVLAFSMIMITSFVQVGLESVQRLASPAQQLVELGPAAIGIMVSTIFIKGLCWLWCRFVKNSSVQALAEDALTDVIFNTGSILFPIVGYYTNIWWLDALGGLLLSGVVIGNWSRTSVQHIKNLTGFSASADQRNILLYLTMRFAKTIRQIQGLQAYHAGDKLNVEVDIVLDASTPLRDSHDLSESLGYVLESVPAVDRAFVHCDYATYNLPTHMEQHEGR